MIDPQTMFRAAAIPLPSGQVLLQVRIGDLFQTTQFTPPAILEGGEPTWTTGEARRAIDSTVLAMCKKIVANGSMFKHREDCTLNVPLAAPCPKCQGSPPTEGP